MSDRVLVSAREQVRGVLRGTAAATWVAQVCSCEEGPDGELRWHQRCRGKDGFLTAKWSGKKASEHRALLGTAQMVGAFHRSFRTFVASGNYDPLRYEIENWLTEHDVIAGKAEEHTE